MTHRAHRKRRSAPGDRASRAKLQALVEEAIVDAHGDSEQVGGFYTMIEENLRVPFSIQILGLR
jgi:hypothetical protein